MEGKKRKRRSGEKIKLGKKRPPNNILGTETKVNPVEDTSVKDESNCGRLYTVSIALPGSIINNAQNLQMKTYLVGQIGRAVSIFNVDEIIVYDETEPCAKVRHDPNVFLCKLLQYLDTPQYLRKSLFPMQEDLKFAGILNPIDAPHHMRIDDESTFREGIVLDLPTKKSSKGTDGSFVNCGTIKKVLIDRVIEPGSRVTVKLDNSTRLVGKYMTGKAVPPSAPTITSGIYWGYTVRMADSFSDVFTNSPHKSGYDLVIGTSERGTNVDALKTIPTFRHLLIVFGGLNGLEYSLEGDEKLMVDNVSLLFDYYLNTCPKQGSRTIRTEEAILVTLSALRPLVEANGITTEQSHLGQSS